MNKTLKQIICWTLLVSGISFIILPMTGLGADVTTFQNVLICLSIPFVSVLIPSIGVGCILGIGCLWNVQLWSAAWNIVQIPFVWWFAGLKGK